MNVDDDVVDGVPAVGGARGLREALIAAGYTPEGCLELLGADAYAALSRSETVPALRATRGGSALAGIVRLFLLQQDVARRQVEDALPLDALLRTGWLAEAPEAGAVRAAVDVRPYGEGGEGGEDDAWWIVSDLGCAVGGAGGIGGGRHPSGVDPADLVLGVGGASTTLAGITVPRPARSVLDLGTGSGVQALHASRHGSALVGTDPNPRALALARLTLALSGVAEARVELLRGSLFEPVGDRRFDVIVTNPPFVISPGSRFTYRDGGFPGDELCRRIVSEAPAHLEPGGLCHLLANWQHIKGEDWRDRLASWIAPTGCDAWVVQREVQDPARYAELWLRDGGDHRTDPDTYAARYGEWLDSFDEAGVEGVGFGWIVLRRPAVPAGAEAGTAVRIEEWPHAVEQPLGPEIGDWFDRQDFLRATDDAGLLATRFRLADDVVQEQIGRPGVEDPEHVVLRRRTGMMRATTVDTVGAGFAGACDGTLDAGVIVDAIARLLGADSGELRERTPESIRLLVEQGFLHPLTGE